MPPLNDEFAPGASEWPETLSRRDFLQMAAGSLALAGLAGCNRPPTKTIVPYVDPPPREIVDGTLFYATAMPWQGYARGLLARSNSGRPTKLEGNPSHPDSGGATDAVTQGAVLSLYDPERSPAPRRSGQIAPWASFQNEWLDWWRELGQGAGAELALLTEPTTSPTELRLIHRLLDRFPRARWYQHSALAQYAREGHQEDYELAEVDIIVAVESDFLFEHPSALRYARAFARRRRLEGGRVARPLRLYAMESAVTVTGSMADHRLAAPPLRQARLLEALASALGGSPLPPDLEPAEAEALRAMAKDLGGGSGRAVCIAGPYCDSRLRAAADALNRRVGAEGRGLRRLPAVRSDRDARCAGDLAALRDELDRGTVGTLVILGSNPVYTSPADIDFRASLARSRRQIHLGEYVDETGELCTWHIPRSHFLESWSDLRSFGGQSSIVQPLISPLRESRSDAELLDLLADPPGRDGYDLVRETWQAKGENGETFERNWESWLNAGLVDRALENAASHSAASGGDRPAAADAGAPERGLTAIFRPDPYLWDGRFANNPWLQELPRPLSHLTWDNAVFVAPALAAEKGWLDGDRVRLKTDAGSAEGSIRIAPGQAQECVVVHLGFGRTKAGWLGNGRGFDARGLRRTGATWTAPVRALERRPGNHGLVVTQRTFEMEDRDIVRVAEVGDLAAAGPPDQPHESLYPPVEYTGHKWGMLIDLASCIGCQACVAACQAENNIPVVGREQVAMGRAMMWIRVDTYHDGQRILHQPVPCQQCENAPCELVCPVAATVHSAEGLNDMVYNRCVGTRFCSNNCPYKVRRFNFLNFQFPAGSSYYLQKNPEVTVRSRGVMEKCSYCIQRIDDGRVAAEKAGRPLRDGEIRTACQQVCPAEAIVFGDLNDPAARVRARKSEPTHYALLDGLNTRPRTTYLARLYHSAPPA